MAAQAASKLSGAAKRVARSAGSSLNRLADVAPKDLVSDIFQLALKPQTGVSLRYSTSVSQLI